MELEIPDGTRPEVSSPGYFRTSVITEAHATHLYENFKEEGPEDQTEGKTWQSHPGSEREETHLPLRQSVSKGPAGDPSFAIVNPSRKSP